MKWLKTLLLFLAAVVGLTTVAPPPSRAYVGWKVHHLPWPSRDHKWIMRALGAILALDVIQWFRSAFNMETVWPFIHFVGGGLVLSETSDLIEFQSASASQAKLMGLTDDEHAAYNDHLARLNLAVEDLLHQIEHSNLAKDQDSLRDLWLETARQYDIPEAALSALLKIGQSTFGLNAPGASGS